MADSPKQKQMLINEQYLTVKKIGQGGFGAVWRAYDFSLRNYVAIKELLKEYSETMYIEMFYKEALIAKNMIHDNIVRVQHFWIGSNGSYYISMDYVTGSDLEYLIRKCNKLKTKIPWQLAVLICSGVLKAIDYANRLAKDTISGKPYGIVYRDISPGNIMISYDGGIKLSDFGIAKTAEEINEGIKQRVVTGKYAYMSPEQIQGDPNIDHRSDIYSIGVVLYEMLAGKPLYSGDPKEIKEQVLQAKFDPDSLSRLNLPFDLVDVVTRALSKNKEDRYEKAIEMFRDLRRLLKGKETEELTQDLANFLEDVLEEELMDENNLTAKIKDLSVHDAKGDPAILKVTCKDFIVGEAVPPSAEPEPETEPLPEETTPEAQPEPQPEPEPEPVQPEPVPQEEGPAPAQAIPLNSDEETSKSVEELYRQIVGGEPAAEEKPAAPVVPPAPKPPVTTPPPAPKRDIDQVEIWTPPPKYKTQPPKTVPPKTVPPKTVPPKAPDEPTRPAPKRPPEPEYEPPRQRTPRPASYNEPEEEMPRAKTTPPRMHTDPGKRAPRPGDGPEPYIPPVAEYPAQREERRQESRPQSPGEEKGKTVFEEVGDWLVNRFRDYRRNLVRVIVAVIIAVVFFFAVDTFFMHMTPWGKQLYSRLYPPDVVITTIPSGAQVSLKTREGTKIIENEDSSNPVELRKVSPQTYVLSATKDGFKPVERIIKIEETENGKEKSQQRIEVSFDFTLAINSDPGGATVFIDGNKFGVTPCKTELTAGEHTVKLSLKGFEELGSLAKEVREGQCNVDFTRPTQAETFNGVDNRYWTYQVTRAEEGSVYNLTGHLFKKFNVTTNPPNMTAHVEGESRPRGSTPLTIPLKSGEYKIRLMDADGRYEEAMRTISVTPDSPSDIAVTMNKWVTFRIRSKENPEEPVSGTIKIAGGGNSVTRDISSAKPLRIALRLGTYSVSYNAGSQFKPLTISSVDIGEKTMIIGDLEYDNTLFQVTVKDETTGKPVPDAYVWMQNQIVGKTDAVGSWEKLIKYGTTTVRIVAKGYKEKSVEKTVKPGKKDSLTVMISQDIPEPVVSTAPASLPTKPLVIAPTAPPKKDIQARPPKNAVEPTVKTFGTGDSTLNIIVCPNCKKEYIVGPKKLRFCTNCGRPFK